ncbi:MAG TPA: amidohydrolase family protein, partial [Actinomycetota bacterium]|nr:amidohydrolase family protein [Actinomycetota bacterium]
AVNDAAVSPAHLAHLSATELPIEVVAMLVGPRGKLAAPREAVDGPVTGATVGHVRIGPLKLFADGAERCALRVRLPMLTKAARALATAKTGPGPMESLRLLRPTVAPGGIRLGTLHYAPDDLRGLVAAATARGFGVAIHAVGNEGIRAALETLEPFGGAGHRIEHAMFAEPRQAEAMARLGIGAAVQPGHLYPYGELVRAAGVEKDLPPVPLRRMEIEGVSFAISSDAAGGFWEPLRTMAVAVTRQAGHGEPLAPAEAIDPEVALRAATVTAARVGGILDAGQIAPGARANLAVLSGDPFDPGTRVVETWIDGRRVYPAA